MFFTWAQHAAVILAKQEGFDLQQIIKTLQQNVSVLPRCCKKMWINVVIWRTQASTSATSKSPWRSLTRRPDLCDIVACETSAENCRMSVCLPFLPLCFSLYSRVMSCLFCSVEPKTGRSRKRWATSSRRAWFSQSTRSAVTWLQRLHHGSTHGSTHGCIVYLCLHSVTAKGKRSLKLRSAWLLKRLGVKGSEKAKARKKKKKITQKHKMQIKTHDSCRLKRVGSTMEHPRICTAPLGSGCSQPACPPERESEFLES